MLKIFNKNLAKFSIENPEFNKTYIIQEVLKISLKVINILEFKHSFIVTWGMCKNVHIWKIRIPTTPS